MDDVESRLEQTRNGIDRLQEMIDAWDPKFDRLRDSIVFTLSAMQRGLPINTMFRNENWDEGLFWDRFGDAVERGRFDFFLKRWSGEYLPDLKALYRPHFEDGRFDDLIREWAAA